MSNLIAWSWSRLQDFEQCPFMFLGKHINKSMVVDYSSPHILAGREVHNMLEKAVKEGAGVSPMYEYLMPLITALRKQKAEAEKQITFNAFGNPTTWFSKSAYMRCALDIICTDRRPKHKIIIDWKTGKVRPDGKGQLSLYAATLFKSERDVETIIVGYVWVDHPDAPPTLETYHRSQFEGLWEGFQERAEKIQAANRAGNWPKQKNRFCHWCPATPLQCEHAKDD